MKIVNVEDIFHPCAGYQINIIPKYLQKFGHEVYIVTSDLKNAPSDLVSFFGSDNIEEKDRLYEQETGVKIIRIPMKKFVSGRAVFGRELKRTVLDLCPDVLYVHGNDTLSAMTFLFNASKYKFSIVTDSHMLQMASKNKLHFLFSMFYRLIFTPIILKNKIPVIRTQNDVYVEKNYKIPIEQSPWVSYGSDLTLFHPDEEIKRKFRKSSNIDDDDFVFLYAGKVDTHKGGKLLAEAFKKKISEKRKVCLIVVGSLVGEYGKEVEKLLGMSENKIIRFETQPYNKLAYFFQISDAVIFPKQCSLSFYDAQACGNPVISEDNNINIDRNSHGNGFCFVSENIESFREKMRVLVELENKEFEKMRKASYEYIYSNYNYETKAKEYEQIIKKARKDKYESF